MTCYDTPCIGFMIALCLFHGFILGIHEAKIMKGVVFVAVVFVIWSCCHSNIRDVVRRVIFGVSTCHACVYRVQNITRSRDINYRSEI